MKKRLSFSIALLAFHLIGFAQWGYLDITFGTFGKLTTDLGSNDGALAVAIQADGKIVAAGYGAENFNVAVVRYEADGSLDSSFGINGKVTTPGTDHPSASSIAIQPDGKIVVGAYAFNYYMLIRYNGDGSLDSTFGDNGLVLSTQSFGFTSIALQADGKILLASAAETQIWPLYANMFLARYNIDGTLDSTFPAGVIDFGTYDAGAYDIAIQPDKKIVLAGFSDSGFLAMRYFTLVRVDSNGLPDNSFGINGQVVTDPGSSLLAFSLAIQPDGKIVVAGISYDQNKKTYLIRYNTDGTVDSTFGTDGIVIGANGYLRDVTLQSDGKIIVAGISIYNGMYDFAVFRYNTDGSADNSFGLVGKVTTDFGSGSDQAAALAMQVDGKIVVAGISDGNFALARHLSGLDVGVLDLTDTNPITFIYPNPIQSDATLEYTLTKEDFISISLYDLQGRRVQTFVTDERQDKGEQKELLQFERTLAVGEYILSISNGTNSQFIKVVIAN